MPSSHPLRISGILLQTALILELRLAFPNGNDENPIRRGLRGCRVRVIVRERTSCSGRFPSRNGFRPKGWKLDLWLGPSWEEVLPQCHVYVNCLLIVYGISILANHWRPDIQLRTSTFGLRKRRQMTKRMDTFSLDPGLCPEIYCHIMEVRRLNPHYLYQELKQKLHPIPN